MLNKRFFATIKKSNLLGSMLKRSYIIIIIIIKRLKHASLKTSLQTFIHRIYFLTYQKFCINFCTIVSIVVAFLTCPRSTYRLSDMGEVN